MLTKYFDGVIVNSAAETEFDTDLKNVVLKTNELVNNYMDKLEIPEALDSIFNIFRRCNKYIDETMPWQLAKEENKDKLKKVLYNLLEAIRIGAILLSPFLPDTATEILRQLNTSFKTISTISKFGELEEGISINDFKPIFMRVELKNE